MLKTILAIVVGFVVWSVIWLGGNALLTAMLPGAAGPDGGSDVALVAALVLSVVASLAAGYATRMISPVGRAPLALAVVLLLIGVAVQSGFWENMPLWYHALFLGAIVPVVLYGGRLRK